MSANAANVKLSYSDPPSPPETPPALAPTAADTSSTPPTETPVDAINPTNAPSTPPAENPKDDATTTTSSQPTEQPLIAGPSTAESSAKEEPRFSAVGKTLWATAAIMPTDQQSVSEPPVSADSPASGPAKLNGVSAATQTPTRRVGAPPAELKGKLSLKAIEELSEKQEDLSESTELLDSEEEDVSLPSGSMFLDKVRTLPVARCSTALYRMARSNSLLAAPLALVECAASVAATPVRVAAWPFSALCPTSLFLLDWTFYKGLDAALAVCPCLSVPFNQICSETKKCCVNCVCCCPRAVNKAVSTVCPKQKSA